MIVTPTGDGLRVVTQNDHAHLAAAILALWWTDGLPAHPRRRELLYAAREHDNGWRETDSAPFCDLATGRPHDFLSLPATERQRLWRRGPERHVVREPYAALLITRHAQTLHATHRGDPEWAELFAAWQELEEALFDATEAEPVEVEADYRWIELSDLLSLYSCRDWREPFECHGFRGRWAEGELALDPFPLAGATSFKVPCREIPDRRYRGDADLAVELASARWGELVVRLVPAAP